MFTGTSLRGRARARSACHKAVEQCGALAGQVASLITPQAIARPGRASQCARAMTDYYLRERRIHVIVWTNDEPGAGLAHQSSSRAVSEGENNLVQVQVLVHLGRNLIGLTLGEKEQEVGRG